jgi:DNA-binding MarR family transcriptional regulator
MILMKIHTSIVDFSTLGRISAMPSRDDALAAAVALFNVQRVISEAIERDLRSKTGLSLAQYEVLLRLTDAPEGKLRMVDISERICVSKSGVTQLVDRLEKVGLVARESSRSDRRLTYAKITRAGREALRRAQPELGSAVQENFSSYLSGPEMGCLHEALRKVLEGHGILSEASDAPVPSP